MLMCHVENGVRVCTDIETDALFRWINENIDNRLKLAILVFVAIVSVMLTIHHRRSTNSTP
jgi:hypothetical protein